MDEPLRQLFTLFAQEQVEIVIIGGMAAVARGVPYVTQDIDFCYNSTSDNIGRLASTLAPFHPRLRVEGLSDAEAQLLPFHLDARTLHQSTILTLQTDITAVDLMSSVPGIGDYEQVRAASSELILYGIAISVLDLPALMESKRAAGRPKDLQLLPEIEATWRLREQERQK